MITTVEENLPKIDIQVEFSNKLGEYRGIFDQAREQMSISKEKEWVLSLEKLNEIFAEFNNKKQDLLDYYNSLSPENAAKFIIFLNSVFISSVWPEKRWICELLAWINNLFYKKAQV